MMTCHYIDRLQEVPKSHEGMLHDINRGRTIVQGFD